MVVENIKMQTIQFLEFNAFFFRFFRVDTREKNSEFYGVF